MPILSACVDVTVPWDLTVFDIVYFSYGYALFRENKPFYPIYAYRQVRQIRSRMPGLRTRVTETEVVEAKDEAGAQRRWWRRKRRERPISRICLTFNECRQTFWFRGQFHSEAEHNNRQFVNRLVNLQRRGRAVVRPNGASRRVATRRIPAYATNGPIGLNYRRAVKRDRLALLVIVNGSAI